MQNNKIKITFLGTNGWYDTDTGNTICVLIETPREYVVLDAGNGLYKLDQYIKDSKPIYLFLSHFHLDHIEGLHTMAKFRFAQGMTICVQPGGKKLLAAIIKQPFTLALKDLKTKVRVVEVSQRHRPFPFLEAVLPLRHISSCVGFRLNFKGKIISYVTDTGVCDNAIRLAGNADLLIAECAMKPGTGSDEWPHLDPFLAAGIAKSAKAAKLALVHFDAEVYTTLGERKKAEAQARTIFKSAIAATDGREMNI
jgi:ribonuclease BN (tRNA processing enzyme)